MSRALRLGAYIYTNTSQTDHKAITAYRASSKTILKELVAMTQVLRFFLSPALVIVSHLVLLLSTASVSSMAASSPLPAPHCPSKCGSIEIPYPFGIGADCAWPGEGNFTIACNHSFSPPRPYTNENVEITSISVETGEMHVYAIVAYVCYNSSDTIEQDQGQIGYSLDPPLLVSPTENVFTAIGCDTLAFLEGGSNYWTGCISYCASLKDSALDGDPCTGLGCCQSSIPGNLSTIEIGWNTDKNTQANNSAWNYSPCSYAFVAYKDWYVD